MSIREQRQDDLLILAPGHKLTVSEDGHDLSEAVKAGLAAGARRILIDLSTVEFIDSQGVGEIVHSLVSVQNAGARLVLCGLQSRVALVLRMANLHMVLDIQDKAPAEVAWA
jgi:anti-sigma B factor antagonist